MRNYILFAFFLISGSLLAQVELIARFDDYLNSTLLPNRTQFYFTSSRIYTINDIWDNRVRRINTNTKKLELVPNAPQMLNVASGYATPSAFYYTTTSGSSAGVTLVKIDNNQTVTELFNVPSLNAQSYQPLNSFAYAINDKIYFHIRSTEHNAIYELNPANDVLTLKVTHDSGLFLRFNSAVDDMLFYTLGNIENQQLYVFDGEETRLIVSGDFEPAYFSSQPTYLLNGSNNEYVFIRIHYSNIYREYFRINKLSKESELYFSSTFELSNYFEHNGKEFFDRRSLSFIEDSAVLSTMIDVRSEFKQEQFPGPNILFPALKLFHYSNKTHGNELFVPDINDSLTLLSDFNEGFTGAYPFRSCSGWSSSSNPVSFTHQGRHYAVMTNGNDPFLYLYEVTDQGFNSKLKIVDYKHRIRFIPGNDYLYYIVYDQQEPELRMYRVRWNQMNDIQPLENLWNSEVWSTHVMYSRKNRPCDHADRNARALDIIIDTDSNVIASFQNGAWWHTMLNTEIIDFRNKFKMDSKTSHAIAKYNKNGQLLWMNSLGAEAKAFQHRDKILIDDSGDVLVFGTFWMKGHFDADSLMTPGSARFFAKLDRTTGEVVEKKVIFQTSYVDDTEFFEAVMGEDNHVYLAGKYMHFSQDFGDTVLHSMMNYQNFLAKYDNSGNLIWARNINNNWIEIVGEIRSLTFNEINGEINVYCSQNYNHMCDDLPYEGEIITFDLNGNELRRKIIDGRFKHFGGELAQMNDDILLVAGSFQGNISGGVYEQFTQSEGNCYSPASYLLQLDLTQNKFVGGYYSTENAVSFTTRLSDENFIYLVGNNHENSKITIVRFDRAGNYKGEKELNQKGSFRITYRDGYFALLTVNPNEDDFLHFHSNQIPAFNGWGDNESFGISRFIIDDWTYSSTYHPMNVKFVEEDLGIFAFPNPTYDIIQFNFQDDELKFETYQICDASGRVIRSGEIPNQNFLILSVEDLEPGLYHAVFSGGKTKSAIKFMKQN